MRLNELKVCTPLSWASGSKQSQFFETDAPLCGSCFNSWIEAAAQRAEQDRIAAQRQQQEQDRLAAKRKEEEDAIAKRRADDAAKALQEEASRVAFQKQAQERQAQGTFLPLASCQEVHRFLISLEREAQRKRELEERRIEDQKRHQQQEQQRRDLEERQRQQEAQDRQDRQRRELEEKQRKEAFDRQQAEKAKYVLHNRFSSKRLCIASFLPLVTHEKSVFVLS